MTAVIVLVFLAVTASVNRMTHRVEFEHKYAKWVRTHYPESKPITERELWLACLDDSPACQIAPEIEKGERQRIASTEKLCK